MLVSVPEVWHGKQTLYWGYCREVCWGHIAFSCFYSLHVQHTHHSSTWEGVCECSQLHAEYSGCLSKLGAHFTTSAWDWNHWMCRSSSRPSEVLLQWLTALGMGWEWGSRICAIAVQGTCFCPLEKVAGEFLTTHPYPWLCMYRNPYFQLVLQLWGLWW